MIQSKTKVITLHIIASIKFYFGAWTSVVLLALAVTVGETEGAMDSASVQVFTSSFAYNFVKNKLG